MFRHYNSLARLNDALTGGTPSDVKRLTMEYEVVAAEMKYVFGDGPIDPYKTCAHKNC